MSACASRKGCRPPIRWSMACCANLAARRDEPGLRQKRSRESVPGQAPGTRIGRRRETMSRAYFVTGTDTEIGKTSIAAGLLHAARRCGLSTAAAKPVASGCRRTAAGLRNDDALALLGECSLELGYEAVNPLAFEPAIAPHLAAREAGVPLQAAGLARSVRAVLARGADFSLVEGAGGWRVPLSGGETLADLAVALQLPVILVVGVRLGCISHALLTAEAIARDGLPLAGWVANVV